jgi:hypothetical protein
MYSMFSTPLICCSSGVTTVDATTSALAPGYWPETLMIGGAISGYCATGRRENDTPPRMTKTIETTAAKIGRSIKKCDMRISAHSGVIRAERKLRALPPLQLQQSAHAKRRESAARFRVID